VAERVFTKIQTGEESGTFAAVGSAVAATVIFPGSVATWPAIDRGTGWPEEDRGRNARNPAGRFHHGARGVEFALSGELRFPDAQYILEGHWAGDIAPSGAGPYTYVTDLEAGAATIKPRTWQMGSETAQDQWAVRSVLINELTIGFDDIQGPGFQPWTFEAQCVGVDRTSTALTAALSPVAAAMESMQGLYSIISEGGTSTAFASLSELSVSLIGFKMTTTRNLVLRHYGGVTDIATGFGFSERTNGTFSMKLKVGATAKSDFHDIYLVAGGVGTERRIRITADGGGNNSATFDFRAGITKVDPSDRTGEGVYLVEGELVDDATLDALATATIINDVASLT
jgi:hypothetical protein